MQEMLDEFNVDKGSIAECYSLLTGPRELGIWEYLRRLNQDETSNSNLI